jgi:carbamate kinase
MKDCRRIAVVAIGGNSLIRDKDHVTVEDQVEALRDTARELADMITAGWDLAITHGNGPQVGFIVRRSEIAHRVEGMHEVPLDVCGADSQGAIGYELQQALQNEIYHRSLKKNVATVITQTLVDRDDPAFRSPSKPIGGFMDEAEARRRERDEGWSVAEDAGRGWRRVVASPVPKEIVELDSIRVLLEAGTVVICAGGGGIPVVDVGEGEYRGVAAVIDKDLATSLLARSLSAQMLLISTAVERVALDWGKPTQRWVDRMDLDEARRYLAEGTHFVRGSMAPKIRAVVEFLEAGCGRALITDPASIGRALRGDAGTLFLP